LSKQTERLSRKLAAIPKAVKEAVVPALAKSGVELSSTMRLLAPVDSGDLRDSIHVTFPRETTPPYSQPGGSTTARENQVLVTVGNDQVRYPHLVEYGTADTKASPFFWTAYRLKKKRLANRIKRAISKAVKEAAK
jgi:HK97 gp10 family phage protein